MLVIYCFTAAFSLSKYMPLIHIYTC